MTTRIITGKLKAYLHEHALKYNVTPEMLTTADPALVGHASYYDFDAKDCALIGTAEITLTLLPLDTVVTNQVAALRQQITDVRAEAENKATQLERKVQELLAITYEAPEVV